MGCRSDICTSGNSQRRRKFFVFSLLDLFGNPLFQASANWKDDDMKLILLPLVPVKKPMHCLYSSAACRMGPQTMAYFGKCFPSEGVGWLVYEIQHLLIYIHLQAMACKRGWLKYERGLSSNFCFQKQTNLAQTKAARLLITGLRNLFICLEKLCFHVIVVHNSHRSLYQLNYWYQTLRSLL